jgi:PEGA domain-containing protein
LISLITMPSSRTYLFLTILICLCCTVPVMGEEDPEVISYYDIYADVNGAAVFFDNEYMGDISKGKLTVQVVSAKSRPYRRVTVHMDGYRNATTALPRTAGELQHVSLILTLVPLAENTGSLRVSSSPSGAELFVDGDEHGITPQTITGVTPGTHRIRLISPGHETWSESVVISADDTCEMDVTLKKEGTFGSLSVDSDPTGADVYLDSQHYGKTPLTADNISTGPHTIEIKKNGYTDIIRHVTITEIKTTPVTVSLKSAGEQNMPGTLSFRSSPVGAAVYIDSVNRGITPVTVTNLTPDVHQIKLTDTGHRDYLGSVVLSSGETRTLEITMQPLPASEHSSVSLIPLILSLMIATLFVTGRCRRQQK